LETVAVLVFHEAERMAVENSGYLVVLCRDDDLACMVDEAPLAVALDCGEPLGEATGVLKREFDGHAAGGVDESPFAGLLDWDLALGSAVSVLVLVGNDDAAAAIDDASFTLFLNGG
jgi:hypothetical protein